MTKLAFSIFGVLFAVAVHSAAAQTASKLYVRVDAGGSFPTGSDLDGFDPSAVVGAGVGIKILPFLRTDITASYRPSYAGSATVDGILEKSEIKNLSGFLNAYFDIPTGPFPLTPYVGAGVGIARNELGTTTATNGVSTVAIAGTTQTNLAFQLMGGVSFPIFVGTALDFSYHYLDAGQFKTSTNATLNGVPVALAASSGRLRAHEVQIGLRVGF